MRSSSTHNKWSATALSSAFVLKRNKCVRYTCRTRRHDVGDADGIPIAVEDSPYLVLDCEPDTTGRLVLTSSRPFTTATNSEFGIRSEGSSSSIATSATNLCSPRPSATFTKPGLPGPSTAAASLLSKPICTIAATLCQPSGAGQSGGLWAGGPGEIFQIFSHPFTLTTQPVPAHSTHKNTKGAPRLGRWPGRNLPDLLAPVHTHNATRTRSLNSQKHEGCPTARFPEPGS